MASLGTLSIDLIAKTGGFERDLKKAERRTDRFADKASRNFKRVGDSAKKLGASMAKFGAVAGAVTVGIGALVTRQAELVHQQATMAKALGISTGELQAFSYAAQRAGIDVDKASDILKDFTERLGDAARNGGGELAPILDSLGLSAQKLIKQSPVDALTKIGIAISDLPKAGQVHILESIADDATRLAPLMANNARLLQKYTNLAYKLNVANSRLEVEKILEFYRAWDRTKTVLTGLVRTLTIELAPTLSRVATRFTDFVTMNLENGNIQRFFQRVIQLGKDFAKVLDSLIPDLKSVVNFADDVVDSLNKILEWQQKVLKNSPIQILDWLGLNDDGLSKLESLQKRKETLERKIARTADAASSSVFPAEKERLLDKLSNLNDAYYVNQAALQSLKKQNAGRFPQPGTRQHPRPSPSSSGGGSGSGGGGSGSGGYSGSTGGWNEQGFLQSVANSAKRFAAQQQQIRQSMMTTTERFRANYQQRQQSIDKFFAYNEQAHQRLTQRNMASYQQQLEQYRQFNQNKQRIFGQWTGAIRGTLEGSFVQMFKGNFESVGKMWVNLLQRMAAKMLASSVLRLIGSFFGGFSFGGGSMNAFGGSGRFGGLFANGGQLGAGQWGIAGEAGPEIIHGPASVTPMAQVPQIGRGGKTAVFNIEYNEAGGKGADERQQDQQNFAKALKQQFQGWMIEDVSQRGPISRSMQGAYNLKRQGAT